MNSVTAVSTAAHWRVDINDGTHEWHADEPRDIGGGDTAPNPMRLVCSALAACTTITVQMYAQRKQWPLERIEVTVTRDPRGKPADGATEFDRRITLTGPLDADQRARLLDIANKCPTHKLLTGTVRVASELAPP